MVVELALGILNDGGYTTEVLPEHNCATREHNLEKVVQGTIRRQLWTIGWHLVLQESSHQISDLLFLQADALGRYLLVVAHNKDFLRTKKRRQRCKVGL